MKLDQFIITENAPGGECVGSIEPDNGEWIMYLRGDGTAVLYENRGKTRTDIGKKKEKT